MLDLAIASQSYSVDDKTECRCHLQSIKEIMYKKLKIHPRFFHLHTQQSYKNKSRVYHKYPIRHLTKDIIINYLLSC